MIATTEPKTAGVPTGIGKLDLDASNPGGGMFGWIRAVVAAHNVPLPARFAAHDVPLTGFGTSLAAHTVPLMSVSVCICCVTLV